MLIPSSSKFSLSVKFVLTLLKNGLNMHADIVQKSTIQHAIIVNVSISNILAKISILIRKR